MPTILNTSKRNIPILRPCIYLIRGDKWYKIGRSVQVDARIKQLGTQPPFDLELYHTIWCYGNSAADAERLLHHRYADRRENGEWFLLTDDDVLDITTYDNFDGDFHADNDCNIGAYVWGFDSFYKTQSPRANIYAHGTRCHHAWWAGYTDSLILACEKGMHPHDIHRLFHADDVVEILYYLEAFVNTDSTWAYPKALMIAGITLNIMPPEPGFIPEWAEEALMEVGQWRHESRIKQDSQA